MVVQSLLSCFPSLRWVHLRKPTCTLLIFQRQLFDGPLHNQRDPAACACLLRSINNAKGLPNGKRTQAHMITHGLDNNPFLASLLVEMYGKCGAVEDARLLFDKMPQPNLYPWKFIIRAYVQYGQGLESLQLFQQMLQEVGIPDMFTFVSVLTACASLMALSEGKGIHARLVGHRFESDFAIGTALVNMYGKCGCLEDALRLFEQMSERTILAWNAIITAHAKRGQGKEALQYYFRMQQEGVLPNRITFLSILSACASFAALSAGGERLHASLWANEFGADITMGNAIVNMYCKCGSLESAWRAFNELPLQDVVSWTAMIAAYAQHGPVQEALLLFERMLQEGVLPDKVALMSSLEACANLAVLAECKRMHARIIGSEFESDIVMETAVIDMYGKCGSPNDAWRVFEKMSQHNLISWTAMVAAHAQFGQGHEALQVFEQMLQEGFAPDKVAFVNILEACCRPAVPIIGKQIHARLGGGESLTDASVETALINMYGKCGSLEEAYRIFANISEADVVSWTAVIAAYAQHGQGNEAFQLFNQMQQEGVMPDKITLVSVLEACASLATLTDGRQLHARIVGSRLEADSDVGTALVNMYGKCGNLEDALRTFDGISMQNLISWTAMLAAYAQHGQAKKTLQVLNWMHGRGLLPDAVTYVNVLSACSHVGLMDEACHYFSCMAEHNVNMPTLDHYSCMIDLLGRAGRLNEAEDMINIIPFPPSAVLWMTLLGACKYQVDVERGQRAAKHVHELDPENAAPYVMLSNIYAAAGRGDDAAMVINWERSRGWEKPQVKAAM